MSPEWWGVSGVRWWRNYFITFSGQGKLFWKNNQWAKTRMTRKSQPWCSSTYLAIVICHFNVWLRHRKEFGWEKDREKSGKSKELGASWEIGLVDAKGARRSGLPEITWRHEFFWMCYILSHTSRLFFKFMLKNSQTPIWWGSNPSWVIAVVKHLITFRFEQLWGPGP